MGNRDDVITLRSRVSELTDEVSMLKSEVSTLRTQVSEDMKKMLNELRGHQAATARNLSR
jgi:predicted  nucleic acid-binding Zn-ribbon protein|tara:strand:- start:218 stop:397 length:180 start_codon:yes stop_codon:yes gene_type:complete